MKMHLYRCIRQELITSIKQIEFHVIGAYINLSSIIAISIIRAGDSMLQNFVKIIPEAAVGKILIQRDEETSLPNLYYTKLPIISKDSSVFLLDPMLATGGSVICAVKQILNTTQVIH